MLLNFCFIASSCTHYTLVLQISTRCKHNDTLSAVTTTIKNKRMASFGKYADNVFIDMVNLNIASVVKSLLICCK